VEESWPLHCGLNYICDNLLHIMQQGVQMMKFFTAFLITTALLMGASSFAVPSKPEYQPLVPAKIVDAKKANPIEVPHLGCIVNDAEMSVTNLEEYMALCLTQRNWLNISIEHKSGNLSI